MKKIKTPYPKTKKDWLAVVADLKKKTPKSEQEGMFLVLPTDISMKELVKYCKSSGFKYADKAIKNGIVI